MTIKKVLESLNMNKLNESVNLEKEIEKMINDLEREGNSLMVSDVAKDIRRAEGYRMAALMLSYPEKIKSLEDIYHLIDRLRNEDSNYEEEMVYSEVIDRLERLLDKLEGGKPSLTDLYDRWCLSFINEGWDAFRIEGNSWIVSLNLYSYIENLEGTRFSIDFIDEGNRIKIDTAVVPESYLDGDLAKHAVYRDMSYTAYAKSVNEVKKVLADKVYRYYSNINNKLANKISDIKYLR